MSLLMFGMVLSLSVFVVRRLLSRRGDSSDATL